MRWDFEGGGISKCGEISKNYGSFKLDLAAQSKQVP